MMYSAPSIPSLSDDRRGSMSGSALTSLLSPLHVDMCLSQVCWSPFVPSLFLTASADWSVRLWSEGQPCSLLTFQPPNSKAEVADVAFCPAASTLFAAAAGNTLQLWDVAHSVLAPRAVATRFGIRLTALAFSQVLAARQLSLGGLALGIG